MGVTKPKSELTKTKRRIRAISKRGIAATYRESVKISCLLERIGGVDKGLLGAVDGAQGNALANARAEMAALEREALDLIQLTREIGATVTPKQGREKER